MTLSLRLSYASIGLSSSESCHFETREVTPHIGSGYFASPRMTLSLRLSYASICLSSSESCHFETREVTPAHWKRLFRESQNDTFTAIKLCEYLSELLGVLSF